MTPTAYIAVPGTWGEQRAGLQWFQSGSPLAQFLEARGLANLCAHATIPFGWSTDLDFGGGADYDWRECGRELFTYLVPPLRPADAWPPAETVVVSHSHGLQGVLYAAKFGLKIDRFIDVAGPVVKDMLPIAEAARPNIREWWHIHSDWTDYMQILGELKLFSWQKLVRKHPLADRNVAIPRVGHSGILYDSKYFHCWDDAGLAAFLRTPASPSPQVAHA